MDSSHRFSLRRTVLCVVALLAVSAGTGVAASPTANDTAAALDPQLCAAVAATHNYYQPPLLGPAETSPVALGRDALRRYHWTCKLRNNIHAAGADGDGLTPDAPARWRPWTHKPQCGRATNYCVYTQATVPVTSLGVGVVAAAAAAAAAGHGPQGLSILTTPEMAASLLHPHTFALRPGALELFDNVAAAGNGTAAYEVRVVSAAKGRGAVAVRGIRAGEPVAVDRPVVVAHVKKTAQEGDIDFAAHVDDFGLAAETLAMRRQLWCAAVDQLPPATAAYLRDTSNSGPAVLPRLTSADNEAVAHTGNTTVRAIDLPLEEKVFASNAMPITVDGYPLLGLFPKITVFNHDCQPNLVAHFSEKTLTMAVWAVRDIQPGEELTINYLPDLLPTEARQDLLHRRWGFRCRCALCAGDAHARARSDQRRVAALRFLAAVPEAVAAGNHAGALRMARALHRVYVEEGVVREDTVHGALGSLAGFPPASEPMADPFGPLSFAATFGGLYAASGDAARALPQLRAALEEIEWRSAGWPTAAEARQMGELELLLGTVEDQHDEEAGSKWGPW